ncbi:MFS transporter [Trichothermofontia sp.]
MSQSQSSFPETWGVLIITGLAAFILALNTTVVNVAIAAIVADLNTTVQGVQAAIVLYAMVMAAFTIAGSQFGDVFGQKRVLIIGLVCYAIGTLTAALTPSIEMLALGWSLIAGLGAALILPMSLAWLTRREAGKRLAFGVGVIGGAQTLGVAIGPIWGGFMASQFSWRWAFGSEALIVLVILALACWLPRSPSVFVGASVGASADVSAGASAPKPAVTIDWLGMLLVATGLTFILFGVILASNYGWVGATRPFLVGELEMKPFGLSIVPFLMALGLVSLGVLGLWQRQQVALGKLPLVRPDLLHHRPFLAGTTVTGLLNLVMAGIWFTIPVFLQGALGLSPLASGLILVPLSISVLVLALTSAGLGQWVQPKYVMMFGLVIMVSGLVVLHQALVPTIQGNNQGDELLTGLLVLGSGGGLVLAQVTNATLTQTQPDVAAEAMDVNHAVKQMGMALGTAIVGSLLMTALLGEVARGVDHQASLDVQTRQTAIVALQEAAQDLSPAQKDAFLSRFSPDEKARLTDMVKRSWVRAGQFALRATIGLTLLCLVAVCFL